MALLVSIGGGSLVSTLDNQTFLWGATGFPFVLVGALLAVRRRRPAPGVILIGLAVAWALLAGDFEAVYLDAIFALALGLALRKGTRRRAVLRVAAGGALGAALGSVQLLPSLALLPSVDRAHGLPWRVAARWSMAALRLPELVLGDLLRYWPHGTGPKPYTLVVGGDRGPWQLTVYLGGVTLIGLVALLAARRRRRVGLLVAGLGAACLWLALGRHGGLYLAAYHLLPGWRAFRYPEKLLPYAQLLLAVAAGLGLTAASRRPRRAAYLAVGVGAAAGLLSTVLALGAGHAAEPLATWLRRAAWGAGFLGLGAVALGLVWGAAARGLLGGRRALPGLAAVALACIELAPVDHRLLGIMTAPPSVLDAPSLVASAIHQAGFGGPGQTRVTVYTEGSPGVTLPGVAPVVARGFLGRVVWNRQALAPDNGGLFGIANTTHYLPATTPRYRRAIDAHPLRWITRDAGTFNGRFDVFDTSSFDRHHLPRGAVILDRRDLGIVLVENAGALPRAFVTTPRFVAGGPAAAAALSDSAVRRGREAVVEGPKAPAFAGRPDRPAPRPARVVRYRPTEVVVEATARDPGLLVLNDAYFPGWRATVDGRPTPIRRTNYLVRGVLLEPGRHRVVFRYPTPPSVRTGALVSLAGLVALAILGVQAWRHREPA